MTDINIVVDTTDPNNDSRVVRQSTLSDFWDAGLHTLILSITQPGLYSVTTLGVLLETIKTTLTGVNDGLVGVLDAYSLERFIRDMKANGYNIGFTDELQYGYRPKAPVISNPVFGGDDAAGVTANIADEENIVKAWAIFTPVGAGLVAEREIEITPDIDGWFTANFPVPAGTYTVKLAVINSAGMRGFLSIASQQFTVT
jgi:hypothetical protein